MNTLRLTTAALLCAIAAPALAFNNGSSANIQARHVAPPPRASTYHKFIPAACRWVRRDATIDFGKCFPAGRMIIRYAPISDVAAVCDALAPEFGYASGFAKGTMGCSFGGLGPDGDDLTIRIGKKLVRVGVIIVGSDRDVEDTFLHETAHLNGLNATHDNY